jgi:hypothetical protein
MRRLASVRLVAFLTLLAGVRVAAADPCEDHIDDPVALPWRESGVDAARGGCLHAEVGGAVRGKALIDTPDFYGAIGGELVLAVRLLESDRLEWGFSLRALDGVFVQNAVLTVDELAYGPITGHIAFGSRGERAGKALARALYARLEFPFTRSRLDGSSGALQLGVAETWHVLPSLRVHLHGALLGWYASSTTGSDTRAAAMTSAEASWRAVAWLAVFGGVDAQLGWYGWGLDHVAVRTGVHGRVKGLWRTELAAGLPIAGEERSDLAFTLGLRRDLD